MPETNYIWFRTDLVLDTLVARLGMRAVEQDAENVYAWVIADFHGVQLDIYRDHTEDPLDTDTIIFLFPPPIRPIPPALQEEVVLALRAQGISPIYLGDRKDMRNYEVERLVNRIE